MKTRLLLLAIAVALFTWSCDDDPCCVSCAGTPGGSTRQVATIAELQQAMEEGATDVTLTEPLTAPASITIPNSYAPGTDLRISIPANGQDVTIGENSARSGSFPTVDLDAAGANVVTINTPDMSVNYSGNAQTMIATTASTTLSILKGATVNDLTVNKGSLKVYGTVNNVTNAGSDPMFIAIGPATDREISDTLIRWTLELPWADGMILTEGKYPLNQNVAVTSTLNNANAQIWYMPIEKENYTVLGEGNRDNIVLYGKEYTANGAWATQNLVTVFAKGVTFRNVTLKVKDESNKTIEILNENFTINNCAIVPNDEITLQNATADGGSVYFNASASNSVDGSVVDSCYFKGATLSVDGLTSGTITGTGNTFDGPNYWGKVISTRNWNNVDVSTSTMQINLDKSAFNNMVAYAGNPSASVPGSYAAFTVDYGTVTLTGTNLAAGTTYWAVTANGTLSIDGTAYTAPVP